MDTSQLATFLKEAKRNTYASQDAQRVPSTRSSSKDYEYREGAWLYHDTYFGRRNFIGEEVVYTNDAPIWGMNYYGSVTDKNITEADIDASLRAALRQDVEDVIPVRGPKVFLAGDLKYTNVVRGDLSCFEGREEVVRKGRVIYVGLYHGGFLE